MSSLKVILVKRTSFKKVNLINELCDLTLNEEEKRRNECGNVERNIES